MVKSLIAHSYIFWQLLKTDLMIYRKNQINEIINTIIWTSLTLFATGYIFPQLGMTSSYGSFIAVASIASISVFVIWPTAANLVSDIDGDQTVSYALTLPIPTSLLWCKQALGIAIKTLINAIIILPLGKIFLGSALQLSNINFVGFLAMYLSIPILTSFFALFIASITKNMLMLETVWIRLLFPLWFLGCSQFPWHSLYTFSKPIAYVMLLNPYTPLFEGIQAAVNPGQQFLPVSICLIITWAWTIVMGYFGIARLKKRLDSM
jgi:hypothetical protein